MTMKTLWSVLTFVIFAGNAEAQEFWAVRGVGSASCGTWTKAQLHRAPIPPDGQITVTFADIQLVSQTSWVLGFLTALSYSSGSGDMAQGIDPNGVFGWIDNYCADHPLDSIASATLALGLELSSKESLK